MKQKIYSSIDAIVADIPDGAQIMFGGFGGAGFPNNLIQALARKGTKDITAISNNCGTREGELGLMFKNNQIKHVIASFPGPHANYFQERFAAKEVTLELVPQGILCERMRAAGAGLQGFYTTVGVGTEVADGKEERFLEGQRCILELPIHADYALIKAQQADELGNLTYRLAARNFNPIMAMAATTTIAEVEEIVPLGAINPEHVIPGKPRLTREKIAQRAARELPDGAYVNLGWGIPNLIADYLPKEITVYFHSENGILGMGRRAKPGEEDFDQVDAMKVPVTLIPGASFFHQADAHLMTRGGHIDVALLGAFQVSEKGDLSNWKIPGAKGSGSIGGAMDIAAGAKMLIVCMEHTTRDGAPKIVRKCTYPLTCLACVDTIVTDLAVIDVKPEGLLLREVARGWSAEEVQKFTDAPLIAGQKIPEMSFA